MSFFVGEENYSFERKIIIVSSLIVSFTALIATFVNIYIGLNAIINFASISGLIVYTLFYFLARITDKEILLKWVVSLISLLFLNIVWYLNYFSNGPSNFLFLVYCAFIIFVWDKKKILFFSVLIIVNITALFLFEIYFPDSVMSYPSAFSRKVDIYVGLIISIAIIIIYTLAAKKNYTTQYLKARRADDLKSAFLANMTHEIRTPLNSIAGFSSLIVNDNLPLEKKKRFAEIISINTQYLSSLVDDILDTSRIESNQLSLHVKECNISELFSRLKEEFKHEIENLGKPISLKSNLSSENLTIYTDCKRLEQILRNLINNAIKFTREGEISFGCYEKNNDLLFFVKDTGIGIKKEDESKIFNRFSRINDKNDLENLYSGTGIGLSLSKELVNLMDGKIWVESEYGKGSDFYFTLPRLKMELHFNNN
ncbi:MAG: HAMP domain-containing histidine kinase [Chlorobi bacterium]|nr:HAMP domain-containing histidine kinase [Chlorobiota bacterium]